jgi:hypothetical protein
MAALISLNRAVANSFFSRSSEKTRQPGAAVMLPPR